ncbi:putative head maturation protease [Stenotrophomonas phage vB_SmaM_Bhz51]|uniref:Prohead core scaffolding protein and protease n=4 Tax=Caudoviricetes TaxID=2731619 RepID=A0AAE9FL96_9CAUD|nr:head maturation protease [Stenotrophomonas maltophilia phage vB_SmaM_Ps15]ABC95189.1 GP21-prohead protease [Stenotrophomonas phage Smp14]QXN67382.1 prohead protease [Stenotrophomonas phage BUCT608]QYW02554.1 capsid maturation protease [Stenotrophomonas phage Marzo]QYC97520.1 hypothetical protein [Stenotrophomonas phage BUCT608]UMO77257.1 prohead core scaffolding protein and protease [Stenotrophomonas maltophilia phage vB_SmaM_Ps15]
MECLQERVMDFENLFEKTESGKKQYKLKGICVQTNIKNRNGRVYPARVVNPEIQRFIKEELEMNRAVGELNHPEGDPRNNYKNVSHKFTSLVQDGDNWIGEAVVTVGTPNGDLVAGLMDAGVNMGISTRAVGKTKLFEGVKVVQNNFRLISPGDIVSDPSAPDAYLQNLMENKEWAWEHGVLVEREVEVRTEVNRLARTGGLKDQKALTELFQHLIKLRNTDRS